MVVVYAQKTTQLFALKNKTLLVCKWQMRNFAYVNYFAGTLFC